MRSIVNVSCICWYAPRVHAATVCVLLRVLTASPFCLFLRFLPLSALCISLLCGALSFIAVAPSVSPSPRRPAPPRRCGRASRHSCRALKAGPRSRRRPRRRGSGTRRAARRTWRTCRARRFTLWFGCAATQSAPAFCGGASVTAHLPIPPRQGSASRDAWLDSLGQSCVRSLAGIRHSSF